MSRARAAVVLTIVFLAAFAITLIIVSTAGGHTTYCGHGSRTFDVAMPNGFVTHRETYQGAQGSGPHYHNYITRRLVPDPWRWVTVDHHYGRVCPPHAV